LDVIRINLQIYHYLFNESEFQHAIDSIINYRAIYDIPQAKINKIGVNTTPP